MLAMARTVEVGTRVFPKTALLSSTVVSSGRTWAPAAGAPAPTRTSHATSRETRTCLGLGAGQGPGHELVAFGAHVHFDLIPGGEPPQQDLIRQRIFDVALNGPLERPRPEVLVVPVL